MESQIASMTMMSSRSTSNSSSLQFSAFGRTYNVSPQHVVSKIYERTRAIIYTNKQVFNICLIGCPPKRPIT